MSQREVTFRAKFSGQKDDCINRSAEYKCPNESVLEAVCVGALSTSYVRCCKDEKCKQRAAEVARETTDVGRAIATLQEEEVRDA